MVREPKHRRVILYCALVVLTVATLVLMALPVARSSFKAEIDYNEGWNAFYSQKALRGHPIYAKAAEWTAVNYPPLSFYITGWIGGLLGDVVLAGRMLSILSLLAFSFGIGYIVFRQSGHLFEAFFAGILCVGSFAAFATHYVGMNDPQLLGRACTFAALFLYVLDEKILDKPARVLIIALLCAVGLFIKHSIISLPLALSLDILFRSRKRFLVWLAFFVAAMAALALFGLLVGGRDFLAQLASPRRFFLEKLAIDSVRFAMKIVLPLFVLLPWLFQRLRSNPVRVVSKYFVFGSVFGVYSSGGYGTDVNMFFDCIIALSLLAGLFLTEYAGGRVPRVYFHQVAATLVPLALLFGILSMSFLRILRIGGFNEHRYGIWRPGMYDTLRDAQDAHYQDASRMRQLAGPAICENLLLCFYSDKDFLFDPFFTGEAIVKGKVGEDHLLEKIEKGYFAVIQLESEIARTARTKGTYGPIRKRGRTDRFTENTKIAIADYYRVPWKSLNGVFYVPEDQTHGNGL
jgi:hypothetical protein